MFHLAFSKPQSGWSSPPPPARPRPMGADGRAAGIAPRSNLPSPGARGGDEAPTPGSDMLHISTTPTPRGHKTISPGVENLIRRDEQGAGRIGVRVFFRPNDAPATTKVQATTRHTNFKNNLPGLQRSSRRSAKMLGAALLGPNLAF